MLCLDTFTKLRLTFSNAAVSMPSVNNLGVNLAVHFSVLLPRALGVNPFSTRFDKLPIHVGVI